MKLTFGKLNLVLFLIAGILLLAALFVPIRPLEIRDVDVKGNNFKAGGEMSFEIDRCKNVDKQVAGTASRYFVNVDNPNKQPVFISATDDLGERGCGKVSRTIDIPAHVKEGRYKIKFVTRYFPSILREPITIEYTDDEVFTVEGQEVSVRLQNVLNELNLIQEQLGKPAPVARQEGSSDSDQLANKAPQAQQASPSNEIQTLSPVPEEETTQSTSNPERSLVSDAVDTVTNLLRAL